MVDKMEKQDILGTKAYKRAECNLRNKLKPAFLQNYPHHMLPGYNLNSEASVEYFDIENTVEQYQEFPYHCDVPRPLLPPAPLPRAVLGAEDPAIQLLEIKSHINDDIKRIQQYYHKHKKEFGSIKKKDVDWRQDRSKYHATVPRYVANLAEIVEMDPDPQFEGAYNWYYTGGSLNCMHLNNSNILLFPFAGELVATPIINEDRFLWKPVLKNAAKCDLSSSLYELRNNNCSSTCRILGRFKYYCNFYTLSDYNGKIRLWEVHQESAKIPYVSADLSAVNVNQYCTVNIEKLITLSDLTKTKHINKGFVLKNEKIDDSWGSIRFQASDPNIVIYTDRCCLYYLDIRMAFDRPSLTLCPKSHLEICESLSLDAASRNNSCRYVGTYHSLLMCDNRSPKECVQQKWTHQFKSTPLMACVTNREDHEFIILSSQVAGENTIILNTWKNNESPFSYNLPFASPTITETLTESQMQGLCLNPYLRERFDLCNVGYATVRNESEDIFTFVQNSVGDVFYQCITHDTALDKYSFINRKSCYILNDWDSALIAQPEAIVPLTYSEKSDMQHVYENFTNKKLLLKFNERYSDFCFEPNWKQSLEKLGSYTDILAPELLAAWDMCEEVSLPLSAAPHQKVLSWLESSSTKVSQIKEESDDLLTPVNTQELISISQEPDITCLDDSNVLQELLLPKVRTKPVRKKRKM